ncbi:putative BMP-binding endothelial regulator protein [Apostichopus japonicus]|uniref:Putative BMP-binding endothelial regulator protein n=1 Tax=Stichopus japonicus TaxID=307972 RepID=A0A2G8LP49_STIJA|nr:putative BMP-binding endothelial regulator protein [Apostichopus japonicus]
MSTAESSTVASTPDDTMSTAESSTVATTPDDTMSTAESSTVVTTPDDTMSTAESSTVATTPDDTMSTAESSTVATTLDVEVSTAESASVTAKVTSGVTISTSDANAGTTEEPLVRVTSCSVVGDPHYRSFDGRAYNFIGACEYKLTSDCLSEVPRFAVSARNKVKPATSLASVESVTILTGELLITMTEDGMVRLDGVAVTLPMFVPNVVRLQRAGAFTIAITSSGIQVQYDHASYLSIKVEESYIGRLCGLCGNYNNDMLDDLTSAFGIVVRDTFPFYISLDPILRSLLC